MGELVGPELGLGAAFAERGAGQGQSLLHLPHPAHQPPGKHLPQWASKALPTPHTSQVHLDDKEAPLSCESHTIVYRINNQLFSWMLKASEKLAPRASPSVPLSLHPL